MKMGDAVKVALGSRSQFEVPEIFVERSAELRMIEIVENGQAVKDELPSPGVIRDAAAWVVTLAQEVAEVEFAVEDSTGEVVRFRRSRSAVHVISEYQRKPADGEPATDRQARDQA